MNMLKKAIYLSLSLSLVLLAWEIVAYSFRDVHLLFPAFSSIIAKIYGNFSRYLFHSMVTLKEMLGGMLIASLFAFPLGYAMFRFQWSRSFLHTLFILIECLPMFTLAPLMVMWFGWNYIAIVIPTSLMIFFPLTLSVYKGLRATPQKHLLFFQAHQAKEWQIFSKLRIFFALPYLFAGLRISAGVAGVGAIAGEWAGAQNGLGVFIQECRRNFDLEGVFGALFCLMTMSLCLFAVICSLEKWIIKEKKNGLFL